jgi:hypothetical protein
MGVEITEGPGTVESPAVAAVESVAAPAPDVGVPVAGTMKIAKADRDTFTARVGGKTILYTAGLSFDEEWQVERGLDQRDMGGPGTMRAFAVATVRFIDGQPVAFPSKDSELKSIVARLGDAGARFVYRQYIKNISAVEEVAKNESATAA